MTQNFDENVIIHDPRWPDYKDGVWLLGGNHIPEDSDSGVKPIAELGLDVGSFVVITDIAQLVAVRDMINKFIDEFEIVKE